MLRVADANAVSPAPRQRSPRRQQHDQIEGMMVEREHNNTSRGSGPRTALSKVNLSIKNDAEVAMWVESARMDAVIGSCARSLPSLRSGVRCYIAFAGESPRAHIFLDDALHLSSVCFDRLFET